MNWGFCGYLVAGNAQNDRAEHASTVNLQIIEIRLLTFMKLPFA